MDVKYWIEKWVKNDLGFHQAEFEPFLVKYFSKLTPGTVFVPLSGKSRDMVWLSQQGWKVLAVEASPIACRAFFEENNIQYSEKGINGFTLYEGGNVSLWCGDFFDLRPEDFKDVIAVYDRAALIAIPKEQRGKYVDHTNSLLDTSAIKQIKMLLISLEYPQEKAAGPPFSVEAQEVKKLYQDRFVVHEVEREEDTFLPAKNPKFNGLRVFETVFWLERHL